jgi:murein DD-endopeptidase / murein LD-carboxypeptidase
LKKLLYLLFVLLIFASCKTKSSIITSKDEAIKKHKYEDLSKKTVLAEKKVREPKADKSKKTEPKQEISEQEIDKTETDFAVNPSYDSYLSEQIVNNALDNLGSSYKSGGTTKSGFDCSGLMFATFALFDIKLPRTSNEQSRTGIKISPKDAKKGDLIFFRTGGSKVINHVGMIVEVDDDNIKFVHASTSSGVMVSSNKEKYFVNAFAQINRVLE